MCFWVFSPPRTLVRSLSSSDDAAATATLASTRCSAANRRQNHKIWVYAQKSQLSASDPWDERTVRTWFETPGCSLTACRKKAARTAEFEEAALTEAKHEKVTDGVGNLPSLAFIAALIRALWVRVVSSHARSHARALAAASPDNPPFPATTTDADADNLLTIRTVVARPVRNLSSQLLRSPSCRVGRRAARFADTLLA
ncbi:hypothetical protein FKP32DRAFT_693428 [Trametes sanguinea]|nr:hypothetical protein FKP32DRAFT_693428 [Trametes sanguinea]